ncbi:putative Heat shock 22 kDa protein, mitochondrial [Cocos nucifera]|uniref:Putative Heat shock 22 kDa protein, mitochondrial n=1 Tax=Cocos nucifera TaxID=13894 RepID=A0A8K0IS76_COCNU|nr:putative Heat shock 22 kDa protein, mitochondrial [Cocos nucifera]KAG1366307.1 putative Heat shock 22 kDa protein, mitochondrial [Cocos nucifera]
MRMEMPRLGEGEHEDEGGVKHAGDKEKELEREGDGEEEERERKRYSSWIDLSPNMYKIEDIRMEMKNGVLKVVTSKMKDEERKDVFLILIQ